MKNFKSDKKSDIQKKYSFDFITLIDYLFKNYLFLTVFLNVTAVTNPVFKMISKTSGMYMYYTAENSAVGNRPCRLFGMMSFWSLDRWSFMMAFWFIYFIAVVMLTSAAYMLIKKFKNTLNKVLVIFVIDIPVAMFFYCTERPELSITMMLALSIFLFAVYIILYSKGRYIYITSLLTVLAVLIDVRVIYLCVFIPVFIIKMKIRFERIALNSLFIIISASLVAFGSLTLLSFDNKKTDEVMSYYEQRYDVNYGASDIIDSSKSESYIASNMKEFILPESYFDVTCTDLVTEWIPDIADKILEFTFKDIFQRLCFIYIPLIILYNHLAYQKKQKQI